TPLAARAGPAVSQGAEHGRGACNRAGKGRPAGGSLSLARIRAARVACSIGDGPHAPWPRAEPANRFTAEAIKYCNRAAYICGGLDHESLSSIDKRPAFPRCKPLESEVVAMKRSVPPVLLGKKSRSVRASIIAAIPLTLLLGTFLPDTAAGAPLFAAPFFSFDTGTGPFSLAIGDLNRDGKPDLATANYGIYPDYGNTVSVLLGNGDGTFGPRTDYGTGSAPASVAIGDLNGDGKPDLAVSNGCSNPVSVPLPTRRASDLLFSFDTATGPLSPATRGLLRGGKQVLVTATYGVYPEYGNSVSVLLGNGDGTFGPRSEYET